MSFSEYQDIINFDFPEHEYRENIYPSLIDQPLLTVIIAAKCKDGIVLVADRKLTWTNGQVCFSDKIIGDVEHFLMGYTGNVEMFDIFRRYTVGDIMIERDTTERYKLDNILSKVSKSIKRFNELKGRPFKVLVANHRGNSSILYHINTDGMWNEIIDYKAIGSGEDLADKFCKRLDFGKITMKEFTKHAYLSIMFMNQYCPALGVGVEPEETPDIRYMSYNETWDVDPVKKKPEDIEGFKKHTSEKLGEFGQVFDKIVKE